MACTAKEAEKKKVPFSKCRHIAACSRTAVRSSKFTVNSARYLSKREIRDARNEKRDKHLKKQVGPSGLFLRISVWILKYDYTQLWRTTRTDVPCWTIPRHKGYLSSRDDSMHACVCVQ